jgi:O-antigen/teichoic acid export membrane protein
MESTEGIAGKTVHGSLYSGGSAIITFVLGFVRSLLLARLLLPEHFGVLALVFFFIGISNIFRRFGLDLAVIHSPDDNEALRRTYFSLRTGLNCLVTGILVLAAPVIQHLYPQVVQLENVLIAVSLITFVFGLGMIQKTIMRKGLAFRQLAITDVIASVVMTIVAPYVAWLGWGLWALVVERACDVFTRFIFYWGPFRQWRPKFGWDRKAAKLFWRFGKALFVKKNVDTLLSKFDDFWIGSAIGQSPLGFYAKAYDFAGSPQRVFAEPLLKVFLPVFARLQNDSERLSQAFFRCAYLVIRFVFFGAGFFALIMPEFIHFIIGDKWYPMLWTFRLLLVYAVFDSLLALMNGVFFAVGKPRAVRDAAIVQAVFFIPAVIIGAHLAGINGVAIAADGMLLIGAWRLHKPLKEIIELRLGRLFGWPVLALFVAMGLGIAVELILSVSPLHAVFLKAGIFLILFWSTLMLKEGREYAKGLKEIWEILHKGKKYFDG